MLKMTTLVVALVMVGAGLEPASALSVEDEMAAWAAASAAEKSGVADELMSGPGGPIHIDRSELLNCLDAASSVSGHRHLPISEVAEVCLHPSGPGEPT